MENNYLYTMDGRQILHKSGKPVIYRDYVEKIHINGFQPSNFRSAGDLSVWVALKDGKSAKVIMKPYTTLKELVNMVLSEVGQ